MGHPGHFYRGIHHGFIRFLFHGGRKVDSSDWETLGVESDETGELGNEGGVVILGAVVEGTEGEGAGRVRTGEGLDHHGVEEQLSQSETLVVSLRGAQGVSVLESRLARERVPPLLVLLVVGGTRQIHGQELSLQVQENLGTLPRPPHQAHQRRLLLLQLKLTFFI